MIIDEPDESIEEAPNLNVFHIGARGNPVSEWKSIGQYVDLYGFDASEQACRNLEKLPKVLASQNFYPLAIAGTEGIRTFYNTKGKACAGFLKPIQSEWDKYPGSERANVVREQKMPVISLNTFCLEHDVYPHFLKLDVQGLELEILESFNYLGKVVGIEVEVFFAPLYEEQPLFHDIASFLYEENFYLQGLKRCRWREGTTNNIGGRIIFGDALFLWNNIYEDKSISSERVWRKYKLFDKLATINPETESRPSQVKPRRWDESYIF